MSSVAHLSCIVPGRPGHDAHLFIVIIHFAQARACTGSVSAAQTTFTTIQAGVASCLFAMFRLCWPLPTTFAVFITGLVSTLADANAFRSFQATAADASSQL